MNKDKIDEANSILERNINFVANCDNKSSIIVSLIGIMFAIVFSTDGLEIISSTISKIEEFSKTASCICYIIMFLCFLSMIAGIIMLIFSLKARIKNESSKDSESRIFFKGISKYSSSETYRSSLINMSDDEYYKDIVVQIYINSKIATKKYCLYNYGTFLSLFSIFALCILMFIVNFI